MDEWKEIKTQQDIDDLLDAYGCFHDGCLVKAAFQSGTHVDDRLSMGFGNEEDYALLATFERQWRPKTLELKFIGLRRCHPVGYENNYIPLLLDAYLTFFENLMPGEPKRVIVWSDATFVLNDPFDKFEEPGCSYIIANDLQWRIKAAVPINCTGARPACRRVEFQRNTGFIFQICHINIIFV